MQQQDYNPDSLFVMCPHSEHLDQVLFFQNLINKAMLDIDAARAAASEIADQVLKSRVNAERIFAQDSQQFFSFGF